MTRTPLPEPVATTGKRMQAVSLHSILARLIWLCVLPPVLLSVIFAFVHVCALWGGLTRTDPAKGHAAVQAVPESGRREQPGEPAADLEVMDERTMSCRMSFAF